MGRLPGTLFLLALALTGCAAGRTGTPPPLQTYTLGMWRAEYRDYGGSSEICTAEPRWLIDQLSSVNGVLSRWLAETERGPEERWTRAQLDLLDEGSKTLPPVAEVHAQNLEAVRRCRFARESAWPDLRARGLELAAQVKARAEWAPLLRAYLAEREAHAAWHSGRAARELEARRTCPDRPPKRGPPPLYLATANEAGEVQWLFCDGSRVVAPAAGGSPRFEPPAGLSSREARRLQPKGYLEAAFDFPAERIDTPPAPPVAPELPAVSTSSR